MGLNGQVARPERHAFELDAVRIHEVDRIIVFVIRARRIDDVDVMGLEEGFQLVDIVAASQLQGVMMKPDLVAAMPLRLRRRIACRDPECGSSVSPAGHVAEAADRLESEKGEQGAVESLRPLVVADADDHVVDTKNLHHSVSLRRSGGARVAIPLMRELPLAEQVNLR